MHHRVNASLVSMRILVTAALLAALAFGQTKITSVEGITEYKLDNGLNVLLFPDNSKPTVTVNITYMVGSRMEGYGETGMAHLLEHMLFKGTDTRKDVMPSLRAHGAQFNASTYLDRTNYFETMTATDENLRFALELEADRMIHSRVSRQDLDSEMTVVRNEFEMGENEPTRVLDERVTSTAYLWHGYGRSTIGARSDIEHVPIARLQAFYHLYYQPDNATLVVAGKFDDAKTLAWIKDIFGAIPKPTRQLIPTYTEEPTQDGERDVVLRRTGDSQAIEMVFHTPAGSHPDAAPLEVLAAILGETPSGRLYKALVETKKAVATRSDNMDFHDPGLLELSASVPKDGSLDDVEKTILGVIDGVVKEPPSEGEVERAKARLLKNIELAFNNSERIAINLSEWESMGDWRLQFLFRDRIKAVTPADVARVAKIYLKPSNRTTGKFIPTAAPDRSEIPATPNVAAEVKDYKGNAAVEAGEAFDPTPANIDARTIRVTLPNGMKLALLPKKTRGGTVSATFALHFGDVNSVTGKSVAAQTAGSLLMRGTAKHTRQQIQDELDKLKAQMGVGGTSTRASVNISTIRASFPDTLRLAAEVLKEPVFPETEFEQLRQAAITSVQNARTEPLSQAINALRRHVSPYPKGDPRYYATFDEEIENYKNLKLADVKKFYADFYGASSAELAVVGDFDPSEIQKLATELFGSWKSPAPFTQVKRNWTKLESVNRSIETPDKANAVFLSITTLPVDDDDPDYPALFVANTILGSGPESRLFRRIREKDGLSYQVTSQLSVPTNDKFAQFLALAQCNPQNVLKVEADFKDEIAKAITSGFTPEELATAKKTYFQDQQVARSQDRNLAEGLAQNAQYGRTMARDASIDAKIAALTPEDISAVLKRRVDPSSFSIFKAGDLKKAGITQ
jgi:zinc protease